MATPRQTAADPQQKRPEMKERGKLLPVIRFLNQHQANNGIERHGHDIMYRMVLMVSAIGQDLHAVVLSGGPVRTGVVAKIEWYARCILEGLMIFRTFFERVCQSAKSVADNLSDLSVCEKEGVESLKEGLEEWLSMFG